jgi:hypothetical protein
MKKAGIYEQLFCTRGRLGTGRQCRFAFGIYQIFVVRDGYMASVVVIGLPLATDVEPS